MKKRTSSCLKLLSVAGALLLPGLALAQGQEQIPGQVIEKAVQDIFRGVDAARLRTYSEKLGGLFLASGKSPRSQEVLAELPSALRYHYAHVENLLRRASEAGVTTDVLRVEGHDLEVEYLVARVVRALHHAPSEESQKLIGKQIDQIFDTAVAELQARYPGDGLSTLLPKTLEAERDQWHAGIASPFHSSLDRALDEGSLQAVLQGIVIAARSFPPGRFTVEDLRDAKSPLTNRVLDAVHKVRSAKDEATRLCFDSYGAVAERADQWEERVEQLVAEARARNPKGKVVAPPIPPRRLKAPVTLAPERSVPSTGGPVQARPELASPMNSEPSLRSSLWGWTLGVFAAGVSILLFWAVRRRFQN